MKRTAMTAILVMLLGLASAEAVYAAADRPWATIGAGSLTGVYFNTGQAIKKTLLRYPGDQVIKMSVEATEGSLENLEAVTSGRFYFGLIQSDIQYKAWHGTEGSIWAGNPQKNLRAVLSLYTEAVNLVASRRPDIQSPQDLKAFGRGVNLGKTGSGNYVNAHEVLAAAEIDPLQDLRAVYASPARALSLFERREIDAFFFTAGHPAAQFHEVAGGRRQARFVPLQPKEEMLAQYPYYKRTLIPAKFYPAMGHDQDVATIGVKATLVASAETPEWMVYGVVKTVAENLGYFKSQLLVFHEMDRAGMLESLSAPIHPGALKYYREAGLKP